MYSGNIIILYWYTIHTNFFLYLEFSKNLYTVSSFIQFSGQIVISSPNQTPNIPMTSTRKKGNMRLHPNRVLTSRGVFPRWRHPANPAGPDRGSPRKRCRRSVMFVVSRRGKGSSYTALNFHLLATNYYLVIIIYSIELV